jgi:3-oxoacyl-[acyl-carrier-protein] synthase-3
MQCQQMLPRRQCFSSGSLAKTPSGSKFLTCHSLQQQQHRSRHQLQCAAAAALTGCKLVGVGSSAPSTVLSNQDLEKFVETNDEWIASRTGIRRRHVLADGERMTDHAAAACRKALEMAGVAAEDVSIVLMATSTPDDAFGGACQVCS